jgi:hypothetical protein
MKLKVTLILAAAVAVASSAVFGGWTYTPPKKQTISRTCTVSNQLYVVCYEYSPEGPVWVPATSPPGQAHYDCKVTVYKAEQVGKAFDGQVTMEGCFEDVPSDMVVKALSQ